MFDVIIIRFKETSLSSIKANDKDKGEFGKVKFHLFNIENEEHENFAVNNGLF